MNEDVLSILKSIDAEKMDEDRLVAMLGLPYHHEKEKSLMAMRDTVFDLSQTGFIKRITDEKEDYFTHLVMNMPDKMQFLSVLP